MYQIIGTFALRLFGLVLDWSGANRETREAFYDFVGKMNEYQLVSAKLHKSYEEQREDLFKPKSS